MSNRAERRRYAREVAKGNIRVNGQPSGKLVVPAALISPEGKRFTNVNDYIDEMERVIAKQCGDIAAGLLYDTEIYISAANILIMLYAMKMAVGNLKTVQKSYQKIIDNFNEASEYVDKVGIRKAYEELRDEYGIHLDFDDCDLNWVYDEGEEIHKRFRLRIGKD